MKTYTVEHLTSEMVESHLPPERITFEDADIVWNYIQDCINISSVLLVGVHGEQFITTSEVAAAAFFEAMIGAYKNETDNVMIALQEYKDIKTSIEVLDMIKETDPFYQIDGEVL